MQRCVVNKDEIGWQEDVLGVFAQKTGKQAMCHLRGMVRRRLGSKTDKCMAFTGKLGWVEGV